MFFSLSPFAPENLVLRDGFGRPEPSRVSPLIFHTSEAESIWCFTPAIPPAFRDAASTYIIPSTAIGSVPSLPGHAPNRVPRRCSLSRVRRHRVSSPEGNSSNNGDGAFSDVTVTIDRPTSVHLSFPTLTHDVCNQ